MGIKLSKENFCCIKRIEPKKLKDLDFYELNIDAIKIEVEYLSTPDINNTTIILCDPMLASGTSMILAIKALLTLGSPKHIHIAAIIASSAGVNYLKKHNPINDCTLWVGAIDKEMNSKSYIIPGLGDAGDLAFGKKI